MGSTPASGVGGGAPPPPELVTSYAYNPTDGRLSSISNPQLSNVSFAYGYETGSSLVKTVTGPAHTVTNTYEPNRDILDVKENKAGTTTVSKYDYLVNAIGQRSNVAQTGTAFAGSRDIAWAYDPLGQVTSADSTIPGLDRAYAFDMIGNRLKTADSLTLPAANNYTPNALNQYTAIGSLNPVHDDDGNMTAGPLPANVNANSTLVWDGENRLIQAQVTGGATVNFIYDSQSRRIAETVGTNTKLTVYDGWNPIAEYAIQNSTFTIQNSYLWGIDLSGTLQGAGGVGGLLMTSLITNNSITSNYFPTYDGNGNVSEYLNESGEVSAHYEYDPFGKTTVATGPEANDFAHRFSTKPLDLTTGLYYYGYRFYDPVTGRWPSRDPIQERGGLNLYGFVGNDGIGRIDKLGLIPNIGLWQQPTPPASSSSIDTNGKAAGTNELIIGLISRIGVDGSISNTFPLAVIPGGSIEMTISLSGRVCPCEASDGSLGMQFTGAATAEINGGIGYVLGDKNLELKSRQNGKYINAVDKTTGKEVKGWSGGSNSPEAAGKSAQVNMTAPIQKCETSAALQFNIGARGVGGVKFWGGVVDVPFGTVGTSETKWDFKPRIQGSWGAGQPVGARIELYGNATIEGKWATKN